MSDWATTLVDAALDQCPQQGTQVDRAAAELAMRRVLNRLKFILDSAILDTAEQIAREHETFLNVYPRHSQYEASRREQIGAAHGARRAGEAIANLIRDMDVVQAFEEAAE